MSPPGKSVKILQVIEKAIEATVAIAHAKTIKEGVIRILILSNLAIWAFSASFWYQYRTEIGALLFARLQAPPGIKLGSPQDLMLRSLLSEDILQVSVVIYNYRAGSQEVRYLVPQPPVETTTVRSLDRNGLQFQAHDDYECFAYSAIAPNNQFRSIVTYPFYGRSNQSLTWPTGFIQLEFSRVVEDPKTICRRIAGIVPAIAPLF